MNLNKQMALDIDQLFYAAMWFRLSALEARNPKRSMGRHIVGKVIRAQIEQRVKGRKAYHVGDRGGHW